MNLTQQSEQQAREIAERVANGFTNKENCPVMHSNIVEEILKETNLAELIRDKMMLTWLEQEKPNTLCLCEFDFGNDVVTGTHWEVDAGHGVFENKSLRLAITNAIEKENVCT